ncbi:hypothetical protein JXA56_05245 [Candidatus Micrarchaeota archaeon]|nr:hypothetical protein [Candidatus Micrarchaeota archaeon]
MRKFLLLLVLASLAFSCNNTVSQYVPAVIGSGGGLVNVTIEVAEGNGNAFVSVRPRIGLSTQDSIEKAVFYANHLASKNCNVYVEFKDIAPFIDGPSAGTALTVMTYAALTNKTLRQDTVMTGSVDVFGNIGPVGGLYEKARESAAMGARYFITPKESFYEILLLEGLKERHGLIVLEADSVEEVIAFMTENKSIEQKNISARKRDILQLEKYHNPGIENFREVAASMIVLEESLAGQINNHEIREFFENEVQRQEKLIEQGYLFSGANEAFLNFIEMKTIIAILNNDTSLERKKLNISACLGDIGRPAMTMENFEWIVGSDLRKQWAKDKLKAEPGENVLQEEIFYLYNDLVYGEAWCNVAKGLVSAAPSEGTYIDESSWKELAGQKIIEATDRNVTGTLLERLLIAQDSFENGLYGAAIFDSVFVIESNDAETELPSADVDSENRRMLDYKMQTLWGGIYQSHGAYLARINESTAAYKTLRYAEGLERSALEMKVHAVPKEQDFDNYAMIAAAVSMFLFILLLIYVFRRVHAGRKNNSGYRNPKKETRGRVQKVNRT